MEDSISLRLVYKNMKVRTFHNPSEEGMFYKHFHKIQEDFAKNRISHGSMKLDGIKLCFVNRGNRFECLLDHEYLKNKTQLFHCNKLIMKGILLVSYFDEDFGKIQKDSFIYKYYLKIRKILYGLKFLTDLQILP